MVGTSNDSVPELWPLKDGIYISHKLPLNHHFPVVFLWFSRGGIWIHRHRHGSKDLGTRDEGLEDIKYGTRGRVGRGRRDAKYRDAEDAGCE